MIKVKLNAIGWTIYESRNGFAKGNIDEEGYSVFAYDYFEHLFFPLKFEVFADSIDWYG